MDISWSLNQKVRWFQATGEYDRYAQPLRVDRGEIPARFAHKRKLVRKADGQEVVSESQLHLLVQPGASDCFEYAGRTYYPVHIAEGLGMHDEEPSFWVVSL